MLKKYIAKSKAMIGKYVTWKEKEFLLHENKPFPTPHHMEFISIFYLKLIN